MSAAPITKLANNGKRLAPPGSPAPSNASNASAGTPSKRQKRDHAASMQRVASPTPAAIAQAQKDFGADHMTHLTFATDYLKAKRQPKTLQDILDHLSLQRTDEQAQKNLRWMLVRHPRVTFLPPGKNDPPSSKDKDLPQWRRGLYEFRAKIPGVKDKISLLSHLQRKEDASALSVKDLKDGWPDCDKALEELEAEHKILVVRTKKDGHAKFVWIDNPLLAHSVDPEFAAMWHRVEVPPADDIVRRIVGLGLKPASEDPRSKKQDAPKGGAKQKKRANRGNKNQQNEHMKHLLQDYSHMKR